MQTPNKVDPAHGTLRVLPGGRAAESRPEPSDEEMMRGVTQGDRRVAAQLYDRLFPVVDRTLCRVMGRREADHDDLVQATFEQIILTIVKKKFARACSLQAWASTIAAHVGFNAVRSRMRERGLVDRRVDAEVVVAIRGGARDVEREATARQELHQTREHLAAISQERAITLFLHDGMGYDLAEIASLTGASVAAAQSRLVRGRRELQALLKKKQGKSAAEDVP